MLPNCPPLGHNVNMLDKLLLDSDHGIPTLLSGIIVILALNWFTSFLKFLWSLVKKKAELSEQSIEKLTIALQLNTKATEKLESRINEVEQELAEIPKFKNDLRRLFTGVKALAGEDWSRIRKIIMDDEETF